MFLKSWEMHKNGKLEISINSMKDLPKIKQNQNEFNERYHCDWIPSHADVTAPGQLTHAPWSAYPAMVVFIPFA